eukprot:scaffold49748_cov66-Phaeocystis_antarctica.AAC.5
MSRSGLDSDLGPRTWLRSQSIEDRPFRGAPSKIPPLGSLFLATPFLLPNAALRRNRGVVTDLAL